MKNILIETFEDATDKMIEALDGFPWENERCYASWLAQTFYMVQHTTRFLSLSAGRFGIDKKSFHEFSLMHLREEKGHELLAEKDLEKLGYAVKEYPELMESKIMLQSQYYWISENPIAHFGFFLCLEKLSVARGVEIANKVKRAHGKGTASFIDLHAAEDIGHVRIILKQLEGIGDDEVAMVRENMVQTSFLYASMLQTIRRNYQSEGNRKRVA